MKKLLILLFVVLPITVYGATYNLVSVNYPVNVNGVKQAIEPLNLNGSTYLPLRAISEAIGVPITWDSVNREVNIDTLDIDKLKESCVMIYAQNTKEASQGSAVAIDYDEFLTAYHVVDNDQTDIRTSDGVKLTLEDFDSKTDSAVLKSSAEVKPVKIGDSDEVKVGDKVILITSPMEKFNVVTHGKVLELNSVNGRIMVWGDLDYGSSGGACFDTFGNLIGIMAAGGENLCFITPINDIRKAL